MSIMAIVEVAIGLIFAWIVISVAAMYVQELVVGKLGWRSQMLEEHIANLLSDPSLVEQLYDHPLIQGLHSGIDGTQKPAYIPSAQFSVAMLDIICNMRKEGALIQKILYTLRADLGQLAAGKRKAANAQLELTLSLARRTVSSQGGDEILVPLMDDVKRGLFKLYDENPVLRPAIREKVRVFLDQKAKIDIILAGLRANSGGSPVETPSGQFKEGLAVLSVVQPELKQAVDALLKGADGSIADGENVLEVVSKNLEGWFNNSMDRLSGWYKRRAQTLAFIIGISMAILLNIDSIQFANQLWRDPTVRQALAAQASAFANQDPNAAATPDPQQMLSIGMQISQLNIPIGWIGSGMPIDTSGMVTLGDNTQKLCVLIPRTDAEFFGIRLGSQCHPLINTPKFNDPTGWLLKLIGVFITGAAAAQGAPFWFDILKKIVNVRTSGVNSDAEAVKTVK